MKRIGHATRLRPNVVRAVREVAVVVSARQMEMLEAFLKSRKVAYYLEPVTDPPYKSLEEVRADCDC